LTINVNPELGLEIQGVEHVIKLHLKEDALSKHRARIVLMLRPDRGGRGSSGPTHVAPKVARVDGVLARSASASPIPRT
jgi:hypothetical protein